MAEQAFQQAQTTATKAQAPATQPRATSRAGADLSRPLGNQARLRRMPAPAAASADLRIGAVNDPLEHEADAAADAVMRMTPATAAAADDPKPSGHCSACAAAQTVRRSATSDAAGPIAPSIVHHALAAPGVPMAPDVRAPMEAAFGANFQSVRVHTGGLAARSAQAIGARAYTLGADIVFAAGQYQPASSSGRRMLAHELAHTLQQGGGAVRRTISSSSPAGASEVAGHINSFCPSSAVASGGDVRVAPGACTTNTGLGCECACTAMTDTTRQYNIEPSACDVVMTKETLFDGSPATIPESSVWPSTGGTPCGASVSIKIPKAGSTMEFGAFDPSGHPFWYSTGRILAHELCGHGVNCQTYAGGYGARQQHDQTIDTENTIAAPPTRGHFKDPRQGESFANKAGDRTKVAFKLKDGWHFEAP